MSDKNNERVKNEKIQTGVALEVRRAPARGEKEFANCIRWRIVIHSRAATTLYDARAQSSNTHSQRHNHGCQGPREEDRRQEARREEAGGEEAGRQEDDRQEDDRDEEEARGEEEAGGEEEARGEEEAGWYVKATTNERVTRVFSFLCRRFYIARRRRVYGRRECTIQFHECIRFFSVRILTHAFQIGICACCLRMYRRMNGYRSMRKTKTNEMMKASWNARDGTRRRATTGGRRFTIVIIQNYDLARARMSWIFFLFFDN
jgi:hypothetical protein